MQKFHLSILQHVPMELVMYVGNDFIASLPVISTLITKPGYISSLKRDLLKANGDVLLYAMEEPQFWIVDFSDPLVLLNTKKTA